MKKYYFQSALALLTLWGGVTQTTQAAPPPGYYMEADGLKKVELKTALHQIISRATTLGYGSGVGKTWEGFYSTDRLAGEVIWDMYSPLVRNFNGFNSNAAMNIEHSLPKSWWGGLENNAYRDLFHLYPSDAETNQRKSNHPLGIVPEPTFDNGMSKIGANSFPGYLGTAFEPTDEFKGDFARTYLYMAVAYQDMAPIWRSPMMDNNSYPVWKPWAIDLLQQWCEMDPVSEKEMARADSVYRFQGNRNPFIDFPELVDYIWGKDTVNLYNFPAPDGAYLVQPIANQPIDFGHSHANSTEQKELNFRGGNFSAPVTLRWRQGNRFEASAYEVTPAELLAGKRVTIERTIRSFGLQRDTLEISSTELGASRLIPVEAYVNRDFLAFFPKAIEATSVELSWIAQPSADSYTIDLFQGDTKASDLLFSSYVEGTNFNKAIEIYNGTGRTVDLSDYTLNYQHNGLGGINPTALRLSGTLAHGATYLLVNEDAPLEALRQKANLLTKFGVMNIMNGNDVIYMLREGVVVDVIGVVNQTANWGTDLTLYRKSAVTHGAEVFDFNEWNREGVDHIANLGTHTMTPASARNYLLREVAAGSGNSFQLSGLRPQTAYIYEVKGGSETTANSIRFTTLPLSAPEAPDADQISATSMLLSWDRPDQSVNFLLDLYTQVGGVTLEELDFNSIDASGKPLAAGWLGGGCGRYTTAASSGKSPNSLSMNTDGAYIESPEAAENIVNLSFFYVSNSAATSSFTVKGKSEGEWITLHNQLVGSGKGTFVLPIEESLNVKAIRVEYTKVAGNTAMDDLELTRSNRIITSLLSNHPVAASSYLAEGLQPNQEYRFRIRSTVAELVSPYSEEGVAVTLDESTSVKPLEGVRIYSTPAGVVVEGAQGDEVIEIYSLTGMMLHRLRANAATTTVATAERGILLVRIRAERGTTVRKVVR